MSCINTRVLVVRFLSHGILFYTSPNLRSPRPEKLNSDRRSCEQKRIVKSKGSPVSLIPVSYS